MEGTTDSLYTTSAAAASLRSLSRSPRGRDSEAPPHAGPASSASATGRLMPGRWSDTLAYTLGYSTAPAVKGNDGSKGKSRGAIPFWSPPSSSEAGTERRGEETVQSLDEKTEQVVEDSEDSNQAKEMKAEIDRLAERILWQAPPNSQSLPSPPLFVIAGCHFLPPPSASAPSPAVAHEALLAVLRVRLERLAAATAEPYTLLLLANPTPHPPSTALLVSTYLALSKDTRKRLGKLCIVGGGWWLRVLITLFTTTLLSSKTRRKIAQVPTLSALAQGMGPGEFVRIEFPLQVYSANSSLEPSISLSTPPEEAEGEGPGKVTGRALGIPLIDLMGAEGEKGLPRLVQDCLSVLGSSVGVFSVGVFRRSPSAANVKFLSEAYDRGHPVSLASYDDAPYLSASLLKLFLRSLPQPVIPATLYPLVRACPPPSKVACGTYIRDRLLPELGAPERMLLEAMIRVLYRIASTSDVNLMDSNNLALLLTPNLISQGEGMPSEEELEMCRVPGMSSATMRGVPRVEKVEEGKMTVAGVVKGMMEWVGIIFDPETSNYVEATPYSRTTAGASIIRPVALDFSPPSSPPAFAAIAEEASSAASSISQSHATSPIRKTTRRTPANSPPTSRRPSLASLYVDSSSSISIERRGSHSSTSSLSSTSSTSAAGDASSTGRGGTTIGRRASLGVGGTVRARPSEGQVMVDRDVRGVFAGVGFGQEEERAS